MSYFEKMRWRNKFLLLFIVAFILESVESGPTKRSKGEWFAKYETAKSSSYNSKYPLTAPKISKEITSFKIGMVSDLDSAGKHPEKANTWRSFYKKGTLNYDKKKKSMTVDFPTENTTELLTPFSASGRGNELSELFTFNGEIYAACDRTGLVFRISGKDKETPWAVLMLQESNRPLKCEWGTVKDEILVVGSIGREYVSKDKTFISYDTMEVKAITMKGEVHHLNWRENYEKLRRAMGIEFPGYLVHEAGVWSTIHKKWFFLPRRCSKEEYDFVKDDYRGCDVIISATEDFEQDKIEVVKLTMFTFKPEYGFSTFKFVPGTEDKVIVALMTEELREKHATHILAFTITGDVVMPIQKIDDQYKYEGIEIL